MKFAKSGLKNCVARKGRKGQFFMASALVVIVILYGMSDFVKIQSFDTREIQANTLQQIMSEIEENLNATVAASSAEDLSNNLDELIAIETKSLSPRGYSLDITYDATASPVTAKIYIARPGLQCEKDIVLG